MCSPFPTVPSSTSITAAPPPPHPSSPNLGLSFFWVLPRSCPCVCGPEASRLPSQTGHCTCSESSGPAGSLAVPGVPHTPCRQGGASLAGREERRLPHPDVGPAEWQRVSRAVSLFSYIFLTCSKTSPSPQGLARGWASAVSGLGFDRWEDAALQAVLLQIVSPFPRHPIQHD